MTNRLQAVLLDLDDTLVQIDTELFTRRYIDLIAAFVAERFPTVSADQFKKAVVAATRQVSRDLDPLHLNQSVINASVNSALSVSARDMDSAMAIFFEAPYKSLSSLATAIDGNRALIEWLTAQGIIVVIATNPLFPMRATHERLRWAGIEPNLPGLALVTHAENSHFTKPNLAYYAEILAKIGVDPDHALMVGDNFESDIQPALALGMNAFWTKPDPATPLPNVPDHFATGTLADLQAKLAAGWPITNALPVVTSANQVTAELTATVAALNSLSGQLVDLPSGAIQWSADKPPIIADFDSAYALLVYWSQLEAEFNRPALESIAEEDNPFIAPPRIDPPAHPKSIPEVIHAFSTERGQTLFFLASVGAADWSRPARDATFGPTTLLDRAALIQRQDRQFLNRLRELLGGRKERPR